MIEYLIKRLLNSKENKQAGAELCQAQVKVGKLGKPISSLIIVRSYFDVSFQ